MGTTFITKGVRRSTASLLMLGRNERRLTNYLVLASGSVPPLSKDKLGAYNASFMFHTLLIVGAWAPEISKNCNGRFGLMVNLMDYLGRSYWGETRQ